ncbi:hypothetical protein EVAR_56185_1 [Eumeta japonica]|uniref:Uncharacterized protein n=1 Tax=Eumeta variegata TaxID=151549 RepID=A0A4C1ZW62_EUMVA|nr:hypothetical protein EVAR_56185_1 [Eumeta japonica]
MRYGASLASLSLTRTAAVGDVSSTTTGRPPAARSITRLSSRVAWRSCGVDSSPRVGDHSARAQADARQA